MTKKHILKKKEAKFFRKLRESFGPITDDNADTYPIGNPFKVRTKNEIKKMGELARKHREENPLSDEMKEWIEKIQEEGRKEDEIKIRKEKREKAWRLFFKTKKR